MCTQQPPEVAGRPAAAALPARRFPLCTARLCPHPAAGTAPAAPFCLAVRSRWSCAVFSSCIVISRTCCTARRFPLCTVKAVSAPRSRNGARVRRALFGLAARAPAAPRSRNGARVRRAPFGLAARAPGAVCESRGQYFFEIAFYNHLCEITCEGGTTAAPAETL
jgi:hypothetical protein